MINWQSQKKKKKRKRKKEEEDKLASEQRPLSSSNIISITQKNIVIAYHNMIVLVIDRLE